MKLVVALFFTFFTVTLIGLALANIGYPLAARMGYVSGVVTFALGIIMIIVRASSYKPPKNSEND